MDVDENTKEESLERGTEEPQGLRFYVWQKEETWPEQWEKDEDRWARQGPRS